MRAMQKLSVILMLLTLSALGGPANAQTVAATDHMDYEKASWLVSLLYEGALMREPDEGAQGFIDAVARGGYPALIEAAASIGGSQEFLTRILPYYSSYAIVTRLYQVLLGRNPDPSGLQSWTYVLQQGRGDEVLRGLVGSQEFYLRYIAR